jgi:hypothetical protein
MRISVSVVLLCYFPKNSFWRVDSSSDVGSPPQTQPTICIKDVTIYSFSQFEDGSFGFWAAGGAGWFEIRTASAPYRNVFLAMQEAASIFYFLADKYAADGKVRRQDTYIKELTEAVRDLTIKR